MSIPSLLPCISETGFALTCPPPPSFILFGYEYWHQTGVKVRIEWNRFSSRIIWRISKMCSSLEIGRNLTYFYKLYDFMIMYSDFKIGFICWSVNYLFNLTITRQEFKMMCKISYVFFRRFIKYFSHCRAKYITVTIFQKKLYLPQRKKKRL